MSARSTGIKSVSVIFALVGALALAGCGGSKPPTLVTTAAEQGSEKIATEAAPSRQPTLKEQVETARPRYEAALEAEAAAVMAPDAKMARIVTYYCKTIEPLLGTKAPQAERDALMEAAPLVYQKYWQVVPGSAQVMPYEFAMVATQYGCFYNY